MLNKNLFLPNLTYGVALSGGADSIALCHMMINLSKQIGFSVVAINIDHNIRGEESKNDSLFVANFCKDHNLPLYFKAVDCITYAKTNKLTLEQSARILRYNAFKQAVDENFCQKVVTAHHLLDNTESILLNIFRGCSLTGLYGINQTLDFCIRPLLNSSKTEILNYIEKHNLQFVTDSTNECCDYTRNFIRNQIIPPLKTKFPKLDHAILRLSNLANRDDIFLYKLAKDLVEIKDKSVYISINNEYSIFSRAIILAFNELGLTADYQKSNIDDIIKLSKSTSGAKINLPKNIVAIRQYDKIAFFKTSNDNSVKTCNFNVGDNHFDSYTIKISKASPPFKGIYFDMDKLPNNLEIRYRNSGDVFEKCNGNTVTLKKYFTNQKISSINSHKIPIIARENEVLIICGMAVSDKIKVTKQTNNVWSCTFDKNS